MLSVIICSIRPELSENLGKNIAETIGIEHEIIVFDNREFQYGISKVYNLCAAKAKYPYLCFLHEDVFIHTMNWGQEICTFLKNEEVGVVGFAGGLVKSSMPSPWGTTDEYNRMYLYELKQDDDSLVNRNPHNEKYSQVLCLDGFCLFVRKNIWVINKFDEYNFKKFHSYDIDFTLSISLKLNLKNFVCYTILTTHFSNGNCDEIWLKENEKFIKKWNDVLPCSIISLPEQDLKRIDNEVLYVFLRTLLNCIRPKKTVKKYMNMYLMNTAFSIYTIKIILKYIIYRMICLAKL